MQDGKFIDLYAQALGRQEVAQLMDKDQYAENQNCKQDIEYSHEKPHRCVRTLSRASRSACRISSRERESVCGTVSSARATASEIW